MTTPFVRLFGAAIFGALAFGVAAQTTSGDSAPPATPPQTSDKPAMQGPGTAPSSSVAAADEQAAPQPKQTSPAPAKPSSSDSPQLTTSASAQARTEYEASRSYCFQLPQNKRDTCLSAAEDAYLRAIHGENPGEQGNSGGNVGARGTPRS